ncbi:hypothetical protein UCD39_27105 [Nitrospirillum sp. BR 11752]|uniref:hypothetical protein n=1 Tax=Nitrospirillum sp. BR 11752 TaxID=3104293 RepID=UPI002EB4E641|nr:hypothetical protein [Nitrospirillum sp. BR 11752]
MASVTTSTDQPVPLMLSLAAITAFGLIGPFVFLVSPVIAGQLALEWHWSPGDIGLLMSVELGGPPWSPSRRFFCCGASPGGR